MASTLARVSAERFKSAKLLVLVATSIAPHYIIVRLRRGNDDHLRAVRA
jgi:hypothetical protein